MEVSWNLDATCFPQDIRFANNVGLFDDTRKELEGIIDGLCTASDLNKKIGGDLE